MSADNDKAPDMSSNSGEDISSHRRSSLLEQMLGKFGFPVIGLGFAGFILLAPLSTIRGTIDSTIVVFASVVIAMVSLGVGLYAFLQSANFVRGAEFSITGLSIESEKSSSVFRGPTGLTTEERTKVVEAVQAKMTAEATQEVADLWKKEFSDHEAVRRRDAELVEAAQAALLRLSNEIVSLRKSASVNLAVGASVSLIGIIVLTGFIYLSTAELAHLSATDVAIRFVVRISLAIFIQLLAYFFLRLYRSSLFEIKYFQNEATNAQFRLLSLLTALRQNDPKLIDKICTELVKTERNFVLKKGETTVGLQRETIEREYDAQLNKTIETILARSKPSASQA